MTETLARPVAPAAEERARLKEGVHIERSSRRVRTYFGNKLIADSEHVLLVYETKRPPAYWFPIADVRMECLEQSQQAEDHHSLALGGKGSHHSQRSPRLPQTSWSSSRTGGPPHLLLGSNGRVQFEEDEQVFVHPRDPYTRVDTLHSSRHVRVEIDE